MCSEMRQKLILSKCNPLMASASAWLLKWHQHVVAVLELALTEAGLH